MLDSTDDGYVPPTLAEEVEDAFNSPSAQYTIDALSWIVHYKYGAPGKETDKPAWEEIVPALIVMFDGEIINGGFHQFLTNPSGDAWREIQKILEDVMAIQTASLYKKALSVFPDNSPSIDQMIRNRQLDEAGEQASELLYSLDQPYYDLGGILFIQVRDYLKTHKDKFISE